MKNKGKIYRLLGGGMGKEGKEMYLCRTDVHLPKHFLSIRGSIEDEAILS